MSYYSHRYTYHTSGTSWWSLIIPIVLCIFIILTYNACTAEKWNNGNCPDCHTRYELRGVYNGAYYYACPQCGNEVTRLWGR